MDGNEDLWQIYQVLEERALRRDAICGDNDGYDHHNDGDDDCTRATGKLVSSLRAMLWNRFSIIGIIQAILVQRMDFDDDDNIGTPSWMCDWCLSKIKLVAKLSIFPF